MTIRNLIDSILNTNIEPLLLFMYWFFIFIVAIITIGIVMSVATILWQSFIAKIDEVKNNANTYTKLEK